jgi:8-oxo-dGTP pyrophosphatase MutT (NUDIX family)
MTKLIKNQVHSVERAALLRTLESRLKNVLPGLQAQLKMTPHPRPGHQSYQGVCDTCIKAGVLLLLYPREGELYLVLTKRTEELRHHQAQISLPGGRQDRGESITQTALREAQEELGIQPDAARIMGMLTPLYIPPSNYCIYPVVSSVPGRPDFSLSPKEVAEIIELPLSHLLDEKNRVEEIWTIRGIKVSVPFYSFQEHKIWGATAMVLSEFLEVLRDQKKGG